MNLRNWFQSHLASQTVIRSRRHASELRPRCRLAVEALEDRTVPTASISVAGATINEIGSPNAFIAVGSGGLDSPFGITLGPDGNVYVAGNGGAVRRYNGTTGQYISTFVSQGSGGLSNVYGLGFGPDGNLYVPSGDTNQVLRYNGATGVFINAFIPAGSNGLSFPKAVTFGSDGSLYVSSNNTNSILRYQGPLWQFPGAPLPAPGQSGATFVAPSSGGLFQPLYSIFGPDGNLYVDGGQTTGILRYNGATGAFIDTFVPGGRGDLAAGRGMVFDQDGRLYVTDSGNGVHRYDPQGNFLGDLLVNAVSSSLSKPHGMAFDAQGNLLISCRDYDTVVRYDRGVAITLSAASSTPVSVDYATADGVASAATDYYAQSGTVTFKPGQTSRRVLLATQDDLEGKPNETFSVQLSNPTGGATIGTGNAAVTITDDDSTRQISIADTSAIEGDHAAHYRGAFVQGLPGEGFGIVTFGPDGNVYATKNTGPGGTLDRYSATTGAFIDNFVPAGVHVFGPTKPVWRAGYLYLGSNYTNEVIRFDATTGAFVDVFVTAGSGGISGPQGLAFGPDANGDGVPELYVAGINSNNVVRYDGATGQPLGAYIASGAGGLIYPEALAFDSAQAYLYVASTGSNQVLKYNAQTGAYVGVAASAGLSAPRDIAFGSDGLLYVLSTGNSRILRFTANGTYVDDYVPAGSGGVAAGYNRMTFGPDGDLYVAAGHILNQYFQIMRFGTESEAIFTVSNTTPSTLPLTVSFATADGTAIAGIDYTATSGTLTFAPGVISETIRVPILDDGTAESTKAFTVNLSSATGANISDSQGVVSILDNDSTKFYVVNDGGTDQTYRYGATGNSFGNSTLNSGNTAPRGAVSTAAGTTVWVVDANRTVYVYNASGGLLGSWTAGGLNPSAQLEGIATNGADIWLVDNKQDKVFKYTGAASRVSGSQNAASSFNLNSSDSNPKDIVTDGTSLWVVDDSSTDKVFKYTVAGTLLGSWTIDAANSSPTGITLDPSNVTHLWIVDNGTDKIYQYDNAATRTSGSQSASLTFALAVGNTNPQGIADPAYFNADSRTSGSQGAAATFALAAGNTNPQGSADAPASTGSLAAIDQVFAADANATFDPTSIQDPLQGRLRGRKREVLNRNRG